MFKRQKKLPEFSAGETVRIRSVVEIKKLLDFSGKTDGCWFMNQMWNYCDQKFKILKVVTNIFDEQGQKIYKTKVPFYSLETLICDGSVEIFEHQCDRSCFFLWHEKWIAKI